MLCDHYSVVIITIFYVLVCYLLCGSESFQFAAPQLRLLVISRSTADIESYAEYSRAIIQQYSQYNDYEFLLVENSSENPSQCVDYDSYPKLCYLLKSLHQSWDYTVWVDADWIPLDFNLRFESIATQHPNADVLISADVSTMINTGCIIVKNTIWSRRFISLWLDQRFQDGVINDQTGFDYLYQHRHNLLASIEEKVHVLPSHALNSVPPAMGRQEAHHKVLHLAAEDNEYRAAVFQHAYIQLQQQHHQNTLPHQLGLNRTLLQTIAIRVYGELFEQLHHKLLIVASNQIESNCFGLAKLLPRYRMVSSKTCFANVYNNNNQESLHTLRRRFSSFRLLMDVLSSAAFKRCPEIAAEGLKLAAEMGYEYLGIMIENRQLWTDDMSTQCHEVVVSVKQILKSLLMNVHVKQRHIVKNMQVEFNQFLDRYSTL